VPVTSSRACLTIWLCAVLAVSACGGGGGGQASSPTAPSGSGGGGSAPATGIWTGTFARPNGAAPLTLRWEATASGSDLLGPMTMTNGSNSITVPVRGVVGGNDSLGYDIHFTFQSTAGTHPAFPTCFVIGGPPTNQGAPFARPYNRIDVAGFIMRFNNCSSFVEYPPGVQGNLTETGQLTLSK
jgi:hypothetical protein